MRVVTPGGSLLDEPFVTLPVLVANETGLLGMALHPRFDDGEPWVYLYRSNPESGMNESSVYAPRRSRGWSARSAAPDRAGHERVAQRR